MSLGARGTPREGGADNKAQQRAINGFMALRGRWGFYLAAGAAELIRPLAQRANASRSRARECAESPARRYHLRINLRSPSRLLCQEDADPSSMSDWSARSVHDAKFNGDTMLRSSFRSRSSFDSQEIARHSRVESSYVRIFSLGEH